MPGKLLGAAQLGGVAGFAVDTDSAREMIFSIGEVRKQLQERLARISDLRQQAKLGDLPEARKIAELDAEVASSDHQSLDYALQRFAEALDEADQALEIGMQNYEQIEADAEQNLRRAGRADGEIWT